MLVLQNCNAVPVIWQNCLSVDSAVPVIWQSCLYVEERASDLAECLYVEEHASGLAELPVPVVWQLSLIHI